MVTSNLENKIIWTIEKEEIESTMVYDLRDYLFYYYLLFEWKIVI